MSAFRQLSVVREIVGQVMLADIPVDDEELNAMTESLLADAQAMRRYVEKIYTLTEKLTD